MASPWHSPRIGISDVSAAVGGGDTRAAGGVNRCRYVQACKDGKEARRIDPTEKPFKNKEFNLVQTFGSPYRCGARK